mmetsp:Transcript_6822/g.18847  ORF Transcript_6822/g.18847 Transcript_6822/m.18847 type:complete len:317 (+) Transcript_6822:41-991(+)
MGAAASVATPVEMVSGAVANVTRDVPIVGDLTRGVHDQARAADNVLRSGQEIVRHGIVDLAGAAADATRDIPVVGHVGCAVHSGARGVDFIITEGDAAVRQLIAGEELLSVQSLKGVAYACAHVSNLVYDAYVDRKNHFTDGGVTWEEFVFGNEIPTPAVQDHITVYTYKSKAIIGFRGTVASDARDIAADLEIVAKCFPDQRVREATDFCQKFLSRTKFFFTETILTGHSLGGTIAIATAFRLGLECHAFNPGATVIDQLGKRVNSSPASRKKITVHRISDDIASACSAKVSNVEIKVYKHSKRGFGHSIDQFLR